MTTKIPQEFINEVLSKHDIVQVIEQRIPIKRKGHEYSACCPFHQEKTPSFTVSPTKQFYYCFGCGATGNALKFVMDHDGLDFISALELLAQNVGMTLPLRGNFTNDKKEKFQQSSYDYMKLAAEYFYQQLKEHPQREEAINYLKQRGLTGEICKTYQIGYAPSGWQNINNFFQKHNFKTNNKEELIKQLQSLGLIQISEKNHTYDVFRNRIMFPILNSKGQTVAFGGRVLNPEDSPKYLNSKESDIFHKRSEIYGLYQVLAKRQQSTIVLVEGYMDVIALAQQGQYNAVATLGTAVSSIHLSRLLKIANKLIICFDGDPAGQKAAARTVQKILPLLDTKCDISMAWLPEGHDPDSYIKKYKTAGWLNLLENAEPIIEFLISQWLKDGIPSDVSGKARLVENTTEALKEVKSESLKLMIIEDLAHRTGIQPSYWQNPKSSSSAHKTNSLQPYKGKKKPNQWQMLNTAEKALAFLLKAPNLIESVSNNWQPQGEQADKVSSYELSLLTTVIQQFKTSNYRSLGSLLSDDSLTTQQKHEISKLGTIEILLDEEEINVEFQALLLKLANDLNQKQADYWVQHITQKSISNLNEEDKEKLREYLKTINHEKSKS